MNYKYPLNLSLLVEILEIQSESRDCTNMQTYLWDYAETRDWKIDCDNVGNLYITKGMAVTYPCVVAHMDTVHSIHLHGSIKAVEVGNDRITGINPTTMRQTGIGGDDKCGIYAALECLNHLDYCKAAFFVDEEIGCVGSSQCDIDFFFDTRFVLQADRRGNADFVNDICGPISSSEFQDDVLPYLVKYNFGLSDGMMTDVEALRNRNVGVSCANISAGYYNPHQDCEYISLKDLTNTTNLMLQLCEELHTVYAFKGESRWHGSAYNSRGKPWWYDRDFADDESLNEYYGYAVKPAAAIPLPPPMPSDDEEREAFIRDLQNKYGDDFPDDDSSPFDEETKIVEFEQREKRLMEMSDEEWSAYVAKETEIDEADESLSAEWSRYDQWWRDRIHNPLA